MSNQIASFRVQQLLTDTQRYIVPMYQRNYAWGEGEINQLIQDVRDMQQKHQAKTNKPPYYIGTLVVYERADGSLEVIDGQQRFTTLTLLALCLKQMATTPSEQQWSLYGMGQYEKPKLEFESRPKSAHTLTALNQGVKLNHLHHEDYNQEVVNGYALLEKELSALKEQLPDFCNYLFHHVQITRVAVPKDTDLNHYFEAMNNRGEQLEKHEVVKARLMSILSRIEDDSQRENSLHTLVKVWDATANMERYVQYGFTPSERHKIFGENDWGQFTPPNFAELSKCLAVPETASAVKAEISQSLESILKNTAKSAPTEKTSQSLERFNSVINFSNFLLHVLRVWTGKDIPLDDKQLLEQFELHILRLDHAEENTQTSKSAKAIEATQNFIFALLKTKYLFDQYIIKREFTGNEGKWSLKRFCFYQGSGQGRYLNTFAPDEDTSINNNNYRILMLLSALHVSTPSMAYKHWLNGALYLLYQMQGSDQTQGSHQINDTTYLARLECLARRFVYGLFLKPEQPLQYYDLIYGNQKYSALTSLRLEDTHGITSLLRYDTIKNNLVFNYLDYLLWRNALQKNTTDEVINRFVFTFRSSVEHFYPQHPIDGHIVLDENDLHSFGNLCLISHSKNSRLSNHQPSAKRDHFKAAIADKKIDSLKLYEMIKLLDKSPAQGKVPNWGDEQIKVHMNQMLEIFIHDSGHKQPAN